MRYIHYSLMTAILCFNLFCIMSGGGWLWLGFAATLFLATMIDEAAGDDLRPADASAAPILLLNTLLYATLPLLILNTLAFAALIGQGETAPFDSFGGVMALGLLYGAAGINVAHELVHRTHDEQALNVGRMLLAFSFDTTFAIEHVYGHHRNVATAADPATARRGEHVFAFVLRSLRDGNASALEIERERLKRKGLPFWSFANRAISWQLASLVILCVWRALAGWPGVAMAIVTGLLGKFYLEAVNYIEHYGLVRVPGTPVEPRHSWNCYRGVTNGLLYNLARHSHHHRFAAKPFWALDVEANAPQMPHGYMTMILASLVPPLWHRMMNPRLATWDRDMANQAERALASQP